MGRIANPQKERSGAGFKISGVALDHRLGTGLSARRSPKTRIGPVPAPQLFTFTFGAENRVENLIAPARALKPAIDACAARGRATREPGW